MTWWDEHVPRMRDTWAREAGLADRTTNVAIREHVYLTDSKSVLDVGCGLAVNGPLLKARGVRYQGVDSSEYLATQAPAEVIVGTLHPLPFKDQAFDLVCCRHAIEYATSVHEAVSEMIRVARAHVVLALSQDPGDETRVDDSRTGPPRTIWGVNDYAAVLNTNPRVKSSGWVRDIGNQGIGRLPEAMLYVELLSWKRT